jgi:RNA polymerase sigma-70 factor (ECF subfamily)
VAATDAELIRRAREDPEALAELYLRYRAQLYAWFRSRLPETAASELTAELFAQVALSLKRFRDEAGGSAAPWLYGIAKNLLRRYYERGRIDEAARRRLGMPIRSYELDFERIEERLAAGELRRELASALESLPEEQRDALQLRVVEELPYQQVAVELGCSETAARLRVMRALGKLARLLRAANA